MLCARAATSSSRFRHPAQARASGVCRPLAGHDDKTAAVQRADLVDPCILRLARREFDVPRRPAIIGARQPVTAKVWPISRLTSGLSAAALRGLRPKRERRSRSTAANATSAANANCTSAFAPEMRAKAAATNPNAIINR
jgi:hypothetical protein